MHGEVRGTRSQLCLPLGRCALWDQTQHRSALSKTESVHEQGWPVSSSVFTPVRVHLLTICLSVCHHPTGGVGFSSPGPSSEQTPTRFLFFFFFAFCSILKHSAPKWPNTEPSKPFGTCVVFTCPQRWCGLPERLQTPLTSIRPVRFVNGNEVASRRRRRRAASITDTGAEVSCSSPL